MSSTLTTTPSYRPRRANREQPRRRALMYVDRETGVAQDDGAYIVNGQGQGVIGQTLFGTRGRFDPGLWRPYIETAPNSRYRGKPVADVTVGMVYNNTTGNHEPLRRKFLISYLNSRGVNNPVL